jgi:hypothetical protein
MSILNHRTRILRLAVAALAVLVSCGTNRDGPVAPLGEPLPTPDPIAAQPIATRAVGELDSVFSTAAGFATATGWVAGMTPDSAVELEMTVDGSATARILANAPTTIGDIAAEDVRVDFGVDARVGAGDHEICVAILDPTGDSARPIGCEQISIAVPKTDDHFVELTAVIPNPDDAIVDVRGIVHAGSDEAPTAVVLAVSPDAGTPFTTSASVERDTFHAQLTGIDDGTYVICPIAPDDRFDITCGNLVVGEITVAVSGNPTPATAVEPPLGHPLNATRRDAGVSVRLSDGSVLWFFGDTSERSPTGTLEYFINNTAAWATADDPAVTLDAVDPAGEPFEFVTPTHDFCEANIYPKPVYWPEAAVSIPQPDGADRVFLFVSEVCVGSGYFSFEGVGMALVEVLYDPIDRPAGSRITGQIVNDDIGTIDEPYGRAAVLAGDDHVYVYQCGSLVDAHERCTVARVPAQSVPDTSNWRYWNGDDWTLADSWADEPAAAGTMTLPPGTDVPIAAFTVTYDEAIGAYVMAYSPAPVYCDRIALRLAVTPVGPWTPAVEVSLADCMNTVDDKTFACYAATAQPAFSNPGRLGFGYFDQYVADSTGKAEYFALTVQIAVVGTGVQCE